MLIIVTKAHSGLYTMQVNNWTDVFLSSRLGTRQMSFCHLSQMHPMIPYGPPSLLAFREMYTEKNVW